MTDNRRRPRRGVRLTDLPDEVVRDLGDLVPEEERPLTLRGHAGAEIHAGPKRKGSIRIEGVGLLQKAAERAANEIPAAVDRAVRKVARDVAAQAGAKVKKPSARQQAVARFDLQLRQRGYKLGTDYVRELRFAVDDTWEARGWRFDFAFPQHMLAIEIEGLVVRMVRDINTMKPMRVVTGRHATITGIREDCHKYAAAEIMGWHVIRVEQDMIQNLDAIAFVERFIARRKHEREAASPKRKRATVAAKGRSR